MTSPHLQVGIDFGQKHVHFCLLNADGQPLEVHRTFDNSLSGFTAAKQLLLETLTGTSLEGLDISGEATSSYWLPFFLELSAGPELQAQHLNLFLLNLRWVHWFKRCGTS